MRILSQSTPAGKPLRRGISGLQERCHDTVDLFLHLHQRSAGIDHPVSPVMTFSHIEIGLPDTLEEPDLLLLETVRSAAVAGARQTDLDRHIQ
jgi:hypothetical protein